MSISSFQPLAVNQLQKDLLMIIDQNVNLEQLVEELQVNGDKELCQESTKENAGTDLAIDDYTNLYSDLTGIKMEQSFINIFVNQLCHLTSGFYFSCLENTKLNYIHTLIRKSPKYKDPSKSVQEAAIHFEHCLSVDVLCVLHKSQILPLANFLKLNISRNEIFKEFVHGLQRCFLHEEITVKGYATELFCFLIEIGYKEDSYQPKAMLKLSQHLLHLIFRSLLSKISELDTKSATSNKLGVFHGVCISSVCDMKILTTCFTQQLSVWITNNPVLKISDAVTQQSSWRSCSMPSMLLETYKDILHIIGSDNALVAIKKALSKHEINWKYLLTFVSSTLTFCKDAGTALDALILEKLKKGFEEMNYDHLVMGLLIARQCTSEGNHVFYSYSNWFQKYFGSGLNCLTSTPRSFRFFVKFLTSIVPCEPPLYLKSHIAKPPYVPSPTLRDVLREYITLAKTRLDDLKQEYPKKEVDEAVSLEVSNAISTFERKGKVPTSLIEMSIFHKSHYVETFLPALLQARPLPAVEDEKMKLISALFKLDKIPKQLHEKYLTECAAKNASLYQEIIDLDDTAFDTVDDLMARFKSYVFALLHEKATTDDVGQALNRCIHSFLQATDTVEFSAACVDEASVNFDEKCPKPLQKLVDIFISVLSTSEQHINHHVINFLMCIISSYASLKDAVCCKIWSACVHKACNSVYSIDTGLILLLCGTISQDQWTVTYFPKCSSVHTQTTVNSKMHESTLLHAVIRSIPFNESSAQFLNCVKFHVLLLRELFFATNLDDAFTSAVTILNRNIKFQQARIEAYVKYHEEDFSQAKRRKLNEDVTSLKSTLDEHLEAIRDVSENMKSIWPHLHAGLHLKDFIETEIWMVTDCDLLNPGARKYMYQHIFFQEPLDLNSLEESLCMVLRCWRIISNFGVVDFMASNLLLLFDGCESGASSGEWLMSVFEKRLNISTNVSSASLKDEIFKRNEVSKICDFLIKLPPKFLFPQSTSYSASPWPQPYDLNEDDCKALGHFVQDCLVNYANPLVEKRYVWGVASHLLQGYFLSVRDDTSLFPSWVKNFPLLFVTLLTSWDDLRDIRCLCRVKCPNSMAVWQSFHDLFAGKDNSIDRFDSAYQCCASNAFDVSICFCLSLVVLKHSLKHHNTVDVLASLSKYSENVYVSYFICLAIYEGCFMEMSDRCELNLSDDIFQLLASKLQPTILFEQLMKPHEAFRFLFPKSTCDLYFYAAAVRLLSVIKFSPNFLGHEKFLPIIIHLQKKSTTLADVINEMELELVIKAARHASTTTLKNTTANPDLKAGTKSILKTELYRRLRS